MTISPINGITGVAAGGSSNIVSGATIVNSTVSATAITASTINSTTIGVTTPSTGSFTTVSAANINCQGTVATSALTVTASALFTSDLARVMVNNANATTQFTIEQAGVGDCAMLFRITGVIGWAVGVDNSDGDAFKISPANNGFASPAIVIDTAGGTQAYRPVNVQTGTDYTLAITDNGKMITLNNGGAITLTIPASASVTLPLGAEIDILQLGAGQVTVSAVAGETLVSYTSARHTAGQYAGASLKKVAANTWILVGNIIP